MHKLIQADLLKMYQRVSSAHFYIISTKDKHYKLDIYRWILLTLHCAGISVPNICCTLCCLGNIQVF